jgi:uncharacterized protein
MQFDWDPEKARKNQLKHGVSFEQAADLLGGSSDFLEIYDDSHSAEEDRFIAIGEVERGVILVCYTERCESTIRIISAR